MSDCKRKGCKWPNPEATSWSGYCSKSCRELGQRDDEIKRLQAKVDALMFEYCPDEMTQEQIDEYEKHQVKALEVKS